MKRKWDFRVQGLVDAIGTRSLGIPWSMTDLRLEANNMMICGMYNYYYHNSMSLAVGIRLQKVYDYDKVTRSFGVEYKFKEKEEVVG